MPDPKSVFSFPFKGYQWFLKLMAGSVITLLPLVNTMALGYFLRCINCGQRGRSQLPDWYEWRDYIRDGCMLLLIIVIYTIAAGSIALLLLAIPAVGTILATLLLIILVMWVPMAIANYAARYELRDAFMIIDIAGIIVRVAAIYSIVYLLALLIVILAGALLLAFPAIGLLSGLIIFYTGVIYFYLLGSIHREAL